MFCRYCGNQISDGAAFCTACGASTIYDEASGNTDPWQEPPVSPEGIDPAEIGARNVTKNILLCQDGKYRWMYELDMLKNPTLLFTILKALGLTIGISFGIIFIIQVADNGLDSNTLKFLGVFLLVMAGFFVLGIISFLIVVAIFGGKYIVFFEMDDKELVHIQAPRQFKKVQGMAILSGLAGLLSSNIPLGTGIALMVGTKQSKYSSWDRVTKVKSVRRRNTIYVDQFVLDKNQVYADDEDFDFVENFIKSHCMKAKYK